DRHGEVDALVAGVSVEARPDRSVDRSEDATAEPATRAAAAIVPDVRVGVRLDLEGLTRPLLVKRCHGRVRRLGVHGQLDALLDRVHLRVRGVAELAELPRRALQLRADTGHPTERLRGAVEDAADHDEPEVQELL